MVLIERPLFIFVSHFLEICSIDKWVTDHKAEEEARISKAPQKMECLIVQG